MGSFGLIGVASERDVVGVGVRSIVRETAHRSLRLANGHIDRVEASARFMLPYSSHG